jgi:hypothetical protein
MTKPATVTATWETQYLITFNTTLPNLTVLSVPGIPTTLPPGLTVFGAYYPADKTLNAGPAPTNILDATSTRYILKEWTLDGNTLTTTPEMSLVVDAPHNIAVVYGTGQLLTINSKGITDPFTAQVRIDSNPSLTRSLTPTTPIQEWIIQNAQTTTTVTTANKIGHGDWAIFKTWTGQIEQNTKAITFNMNNPITLNAVFFKANPVAESIAYSSISGIAAVIALSLVNRRKPAQKHKNQRAAGTGAVITAASLIAASVASIRIAIGYGIPLNQLLDFTNWAVIVTIIEAIIFLAVSTIIVKKVQKQNNTQVVLKIPIPQKK